MSELKEIKNVSEDIFKGKILHLQLDMVELPNGHLAHREVIRHIGAVCVIPVTDDGKVIMERQYRYPIDEVIWEIPAGKLDRPDEDPLEAAKRELREETGYSADDWQELGTFYPAAAYCDEKIHMYLARGLRSGESHPDDDEFLEVSLVPLKELAEKVMAGEIPDAKTQVAVLKAAKLLM
ncbi:MAG: NUDIX hydrolase [Oscillospiraceae bacterium]|nr:NUDIX hydrolase [Oscillospiraceae bacterium]